MYVYLPDVKVPSTYVTYTLSDTVTTSWAPCNDRMRIVCVSDTHGLHRELQLPPGDVLIHCGDIVLNRCSSRSRKLAELHWRDVYGDFNAWLQTTPHRHRVVIGGNHDEYLEQVGPLQSQELLSACVYLCYSGVVIDGVRFFGIPYSQGRSSNKAFQRTRQLEAHAAKWDGGSGVDVLIVHGAMSGPNSLLPQLAPFQPNVVICGHDHNTFGVRGVHSSPACVINASVLDRKYCMSHPPIVFDIPRKM